MEAKKLLVAEQSKRQAASYAIKGNYARAFAHYLVVLKLSPSSALNLREDLVYVLRELGILLEGSKKIEELFKCYQQAIESLPLCEEIHNNFGAHLVRLGHPEEAAVYFFNALKLNPDFISAKSNLENVYNALIERWHFPMLNDTKRNLSYRNAIYSAVQNGWDTVLDIGSGTGLLSMFALEAGAKEVIACELSKTMHAVAREVLIANNMQNKIQMFNLHSSQLRTKTRFSRVKLVVTEIMDCGLLGENILSSVHDAWQHLLVLPNPNQQETTERSGRVIPAGATVWAVLVESKYVRQRNRLLNQKLGELDLKAFCDASLIADEPYLAEKVDSLPGGVTFLSKPEPIRHLNFNDPQTVSDYLLESTPIFKTMHCEQDGFLDGIAMWFDLCLDADIHICTSDNTCWEQAIFPVNASSSLKVTNGSKVEVQCTMKENCISLSCFAVETNKIASLQKDYVVQPCSSLKLSRKDLLLANSECYWSAVNKGLLELVTPSKTVRDTNDVPLGAFLALTMKAKCVAVPDTFDKAFALVFASDNNVNSSCIQFLRTEPESTTRHDEDQQWDIIIVNPVESVGMLKQGVLEEVVTLSRTLQNSGGIFMPSDLTICALLVESQALLEMNRLIDDNRATGYRIAEFINLFKASLHLDFYLSSTSHKRLSKVIEILTINFGEASSDLEERGLRISHCTDGLTKAAGQVHAVVVWFKYQMTKTVAVSTLDDSAMWKQAAFILDKPVSVHAQQSFTLTAVYERSCLSVELICK